MGRSIDELIEMETENSEMTRNDPMPAILPAHVTVTRGGRRNHTLQIRIDDGELDALNRLAKEKNMPPSTLARSILLSAIAPKRPIAEVLNQIESDVQALRGHLVSA